MHIVDHVSLAQFFDTVAIPLNLPVMIWGMPGVGKSDAVRQLADRMGAVLVDIRLSQYDSVDLRGIPVPEKGLTVWNMPGTLPFVGNDAFPDNRPIVLFFDEINSAEPAVMAVAYQLILDGACGEHRLKPNVYKIAAGNRDGDKGVTNKMPLPLANRFCHVELGVSADVAVAYMMGKVPAECVAFLSFRKPLVSTFDPARGERVFATPRTWMAAFRVYASKAPEEAKRIGMAGLVGEGAAVEFWGFIENIKNVIPVSKILADPAGAPLPDELSMRYATAVSVSGAMDLKNVSALHTYLTRMDPEFLILAWQLALKRDNALLGAPEFLKLATQYRTLFQP
jgi:hypothetical protein